MDREIGDLVISLRGEISELKKDFGLVTNELNKFQKQNKSVFASLKKNWLLYAGGITAVVYSLKKLTQPFIQFRQKMLEVNTLTNLSERSLKKFENTILELTAKVPQSADELANALYDIVSAGVGVADAARVLEQSSKAAIAGVTNTKTAANAGLSVINAYGKSMSELGNIYDILFQTVKEGVITFEQLAASVGTVLPVASAADEDFKNIAASIAVLTKQGIDARQATTFLRSGILALTAPTEQAKEAMRKMGIEWKGWIPTLRQIQKLGLDLEGLRQIIPDVRAGQAIIALTNNLEDLESVLSEMDDAAGSMQTAYGIMMQSPENQIKLLSNSINYLGIALTRAFSPAMITLIRELTNALNDNVIIWQRLNYEQRQNAAYIDYFAEQIKIFKIRRDELEKERDVLKSEGKEITAINEKIERYNKAIIKMAKMSTGYYKEYSDSLKSIKPSETPTATAPTTPTATPFEKIEEGSKAAAISLKLFNEQVKTAFQELDNAYKDGELSVEQYYNARRQLAESVYNTEIDALNNLYANTDDETKQREIREDILVREVQYERELINLKREEAEANSELASSQEQVNKLLSDIEYRAKYESANEYQQQVLELQRRQEDERQNIIKNSLNVERDLHRAEITWQKEQSRLLVDYEMRMQQQRLEVATQAAGNMKNVFSGLYSASGEHVEAFFYLTQAAAAAEAAVNGALAITKSYTVDPYGFLAATIAASVGVQIGNILAQTIAGPPKGMALGGEVEGPSGIDKVPARLTRGEFVEPLNAVNYYGKGVMEAIRRRAIPKELFAGYGNLAPRSPSFGRYAEGGVAKSGTPGKDANLQITNIVDPNIFGQYLSQKPGEEMILNIISNNAYKIKRRLGI